MKIDFEYNTAYGVFRDALYLPDDHTYTEEQIVEMQTARVNSWLQSVENPQTPETMTVVIDGITYEKVEVGGQILLKPIGG